MTNETIYHPMENGASDAIFRLLGGNERVLLQIAQDGHVVWLSRGAEMLLDLKPMDAVGEALSKQTAEAVLQAAREGGWLELEEELNGTPWRLRGQPIEGGLMLLAEPCEENITARNIDFIRNQQIERSISRMILKINTAERCAQTREEMDEWRWYAKQLRQIWRASVHSEILNGQQRLDNRLMSTDVLLLCRQLAELVSDRTGIPIKVRGDAVWAVISGEETQCIVLNLLTNAVLRKPDHIFVEVRKKKGYVRIAVSHDGASMESSCAANALSGWRGLSDYHRLEDLVGMGLGLPVVQVLLGQRGGSLIADTDGEMTRFIAMLPDDLPADSGVLRQAKIVSGFDLIALELSVLD